MLEALVLSRAIGFALVLARIAGFVLVSPFPGQNVSTTQRTGLVVALSWVASLYAPVANVPREISLSLAITVANETGCGLVMGCAFRFLYVAAEFLGQVVSQSIGLSMASVLNPTTRAEDIVLTRIITLMAELLALAAGVHRTALAYLLHSFRALPVGLSLALPESSHLLVDLGIRSMTVGLELGMPVVAISLVVHVALAMIARAAPALQILHVGLSVVLATGFLTMLTTLPDIDRGLAAHYATLGRVLDQIMTAIAVPAR
jgi:flagellar biosynthetic protein FliR